MENRSFRIITHDDAEENGRMCCAITCIMKREPVKYPKSSFKHAPRPSKNKSLSLTMILHSIMRVGPICVPITIQSSIALAHARSYNVHSSRSIPEYHKLNNPSVGRLRPYHTIKRRKNAMLFVFARLCQSGTKYKQSLCSWWSPKVVFFQKEWIYAEMYRHNIIIRSV